MAIKKLKYLEDPNDSDSLLFEYYDVKDIEKAIMELRVLIEDFENLTCVEFNLKYPEFVKINNINIILLQTINKYFKDFQ